MGQRAYGDDATEAKKASQILKSKRTTSFSTGLRVCGCQVQLSAQGGSKEVLTLWKGYSIEVSEFWQLHKYEGRRLTESNMPLAFMRFFQNGRELRTDVVEVFLEKLRDVQQVIQRREFRFYSTSLLLVYDGAATTPDVRLKMIDFSHTFPAAHAAEIDDGYLLGLHNLIGILESLLQTPPVSPQRNQSV